MEQKTTLRIQENVSFSELGSYHIGGPVRYFATPQSEEEVLYAITMANQHKWPVFVLGGGTNLLMKDDGFHGFMIRPEVRFIERRENHLRVGAGVLVSDLLNYATEENLAGLEWAGGLPGTIGGAVRGNAGCFGRETKDIVEQVESIDLQTGEKKVRSIAECEFGYRASIFKSQLDNREIITAATFVFTPGDHISIKTIADDHIRYRRERQPLEYPNIGSIFKNVDARNFSNEKIEPFSSVLKQDPFLVIPTAYLIAESGLKGEQVGGAMISPKHPNFIINTGGATARDVKTLILKAQMAVKAKFGIDIEPEVIEI